MVESMDYAPDVERLFSWLKAPMVHYREFAPQMEVAEAVATWPAVHRAAVRTGVAPQDEPGPHGDAAVRERLARDRRLMPPPPVQAVEEAPLPGAEAAPTPGRLSDRPSGEPPVQHAVVAAPAEDGRAPPPAIAGFDEPPAVRQSAPPPPGSRLFGGYRDARPAAAGSERQDRSLGAVFSRIGGGRDRLPDPRERARTAPGLGAVFERLR